MFKNNGENIKLGDVLSRKFINDLLSVFSKSAGLASVCMDNERNFTNEISVTDFCKKVTSSSQKCANVCLANRIRGGENAVETGEPCIYECACGLKNFAVPILVDNKHHGTIVCGQVLTETVDKEKIKKNLQEMGLDYNNYAEEFHNLKLIKDERLKETANYIHEVATTFSSVSTLNSQKAKQQELLLTLLRATDINYDIEDIVKIALESMCKIFNIERGLVVSFIDDVPKIEYDYITTDKISPINVVCTPDEYKNVFDAWKLFLYQSGGDIYFNDINDIRIEKEVKELYLKAGLKSAMAYLMRTEGKLRIVILAKYNEKHVWTKQQNAFLKLVAEQLSIAINHAELKDKLSKLKALQDAIIKSLPIPALIKDLNGKYIEVNKSFLKLKNLKNHSIIGCKDEDIWEDEDTADFFKNCDKRLIDTGKPITIDREFEVDGEKYSDSVYLFPVFQDARNEKMMAVFGIVKERKISK